MNADFDILPQGLHPTAEAVETLFKRDHGLIRVKREMPIEDDLEWSPTITGVTRDHHLVCIEVTQGSYLMALDSFIVECTARDLPVRLYIACPEDAMSNDEIAKTFKAATTRGVGIISVKGTKCTILRNAITLSLASVRKIRPQDFPARYRQALQDAQLTFLNGDPSRGCSRVYEEIEALSRRIAAKTHEKGLWKQNVTINFTIDGWAKVLNLLVEKLDFTKCNYLDRQTVQRVQGLTDYRNAVSHKSNSAAALVKRDRELRTRFEAAVDIFLELQGAAKALKL